MILDYMLIGLVLVCLGLLQHERRQSNKKEQSYIKAILAKNVYEYNDTTLTHKDVKAAAKLEKDLLKERKKIVAENILKEGIPIG